MKRLCLKTVAAVALAFVLIGVGAGPVAAASGEICPYVTLWGKRYEIICIPVP